MEKISTLPFLLIAQVGILIYAIRGTRLNTLERVMSYSFLGGVSIWSLISSHLAIKETFLSEDFLNSLPGFWITNVIPLFAVLLISFSKHFREAIKKIYSNYGRSGVIQFQSMRVLALGGIFKAAAGTFTPYFGLYIGVPDFIFGLLCLFFLIQARKRNIEKKDFYLLMTYGVFIIVPVGMTLINIGLPGALFLYDDHPSIKAIFEFPMSLAPTVVVPLFIVIQIFALVEEFRR